MSKASEEEIRNNIIPLVFNSLDSNNLLGQVELFHIHLSSHSQQNSSFNFLFFSLFVFFIILIFLFIYLFSIIFFSNVMAHRKSISFSFVVVKTYKLESEKAAFYGRMNFGVFIIEISSIFLLSRKLL